MKKAAVIIFGIIILAAAAFIGISYYLNSPDIVIANAFSNNKKTSSYNGNMDLKVNFDTSKVMNTPGVQDNALMQSEIQIIKNTLDSSPVKLIFNGESKDKTALINGSYTIPEALGQSSSFAIYGDNMDTWAKIGDGEWTKAGKGIYNLSSDDDKAANEAALNFLKKCSIKEDGDKLIITMNPKYEDIKDMIPASVQDEINKTSSNTLTFEQIFNALYINAVITVDKNNSFFIPHPSVSKVDISINGDISKIMPDIKNVPDDVKAILQGISFNLSGTVSIQKDANLNIQKPDGI